MGYPDGGLHLAASLPLHGRLPACLFAMRDSTVVRHAGFKFTLRCPLATLSACGQPLGPTGQPHSLRHDLGMPLITVTVGVATGELKVHKGLCRLTGPSLLTGIIRPTNSK